MNSTLLSSISNLVAEMNKIPSAQQLDPGVSRAERVIGAVGWMPHGNPDGRSPPEFPERDQ